LSSKRLAESHGHLHRHNKPAQQALQLITHAAAAAAFDTVSACVLVLSKAFGTIVWERQACRAFLLLEGTFKVAQAYCEIGCNYNLADAVKFPDQSSAENVAWSIVPISTAKILTGLSNGCTV